jgi:Ca-activated chloride channel homolog
MRRFALLPAFALSVVSFTVNAQQSIPPVPPIASPPQQDAAQPHVFRTGAAMVALNVTVLDGKSPVSGLSQGDFEVYEDGVQQSVRFFESRTVPLDVILLLDTSSSMTDKMDVVHNAARGFMKILRREDRGAVVAFADSVKIVQPLTSDAAAIEAAINATEPKGSTSLYNAVYVALKEFGRQAHDTSGVRRQAIAVLSDGEDTASVVSFDDVMALAKRTGVSIYTIALQSSAAALRSGAGPKRQFSDAEYAMKSLAQETGAQSFFPASVHQLKNVYDTITAELMTQYSLGYSPTNARNDGRYRRIVVRVGTNPNYRPRTRTGYTADAPTRASSAALENRR